MSDVIQFDIKIFYPNTKLIINDINENFSLIDAVLNEQSARLEILEALPK